MRDAWTVRHRSESADPDEAEQRLQAFHGWLKEAAAEFAAVTTGTAGQIIPPGYKPLLAAWTQDRPLFAAATRSTITDATSFTLPAQVVDTGIDAAVGTQTEGTNQADNAALTFTPATVSPTGIVGLFRCTREIVDASNPAIDALALAVMRESYGRQTEARIFTELNTVQSGTITGGLVPPARRLAPRRVPRCRPTCARRSLPTRTSAACDRGPRSRPRGRRWRRRWRPWTGRRCRKGRKRLQSRTGAAFT